MIVRLIQGDITGLQFDGIVNSANSSLLGGGGVDGAIHRKGGPSILEDCRRIRARQGGCETGEAVYTTAGNLPARYVIHTVGPVWQGGEHGEARLLANCYTNALRLAESLGVKSVAFPNISTGVYGYPKPEAARVAVAAVKGFGNEAKSVEEVVFVCFDEENFSLYNELIG